MSGSFFFLYVILHWIIIGNVLIYNLLSQTQENVWKRSCEFRVTATSSLRKWGVRPNRHTQPQAMISTIAEYVPVFEAPQLFRWNGYWVEIKRSKTLAPYNPEILGGQLSATMYLTWDSTSFMIFRFSDIWYTTIRMYTRDMKAITSLVEHAKRQYLEISRPNVVVHTADQVRS